MTDEITVFKPRNKSQKEVIKDRERAAKKELLKQQKRLRAERQNIKGKIERVDAKIDKIEAVSEVLEGKKTIITREELDTSHPFLTPFIAQKPVIFEPNPGPQTEFLAASEDQVFYGGARGGGKSYAMLVDPIRDCDKPTHRALLIRRTMPELRDLINHSLMLYKRAYPTAKFSQQEKEWKFPSGARIEFGYAENLADALRYQGQSYSWIGVDELPQFPDAEVWNFLQSSLRSVDPNIHPCMRATGNPGNIGSHWVREMFIDAAPWNTTFHVPVDTYQGRKYISRKFIPARLTDNPYLTQTDNYLVTLSSLPEIKRKQFLDGDWDVFEGSAFPDFDRSTHVVDPFQIPNNWTRFRAGDFGYSSPSCILWVAVDFDNNFWVYRELYIKNLTADLLADRILWLEQGERINYGVLDASTWAKRGDVGPGIAETMVRRGCRWRPSDRSPNSRVNGKLEMHRRFAKDGITQQPKLKIFSTCRNLIRTLPQLPCDPNNMEDVDTRAEDHAYDALRYACMSRPMGPIAYADLIREHSLRRPVPADRTFGY